MCIAEAPGAQEDKFGVPLIGPTGKLLRQTLMPLAGVNEGETYFTNVFKQRPPNNRKPTKLEIVRALPELLSEIECVDPRVIILLGDTAIQVFFPGEPVGMVHGFPRERDGRMFVPMYHPAACMHNPNLRSVIERDWRELPNKLYRGIQNAPTTVGLGEHPSIEASFMAVDTETISLEDRRLIGVSISVSPHEAAWGIPECIRTSTLIMHNAKYDLDVLERAGITLEYDRLLDTMLAAYILGESRLGLKLLVLKHFGKDMDRLDKMLSEERWRQVEEWMQGFTPSKKWAKSLATLPSNPYETIKRRPALRAYLEGELGPMPDPQISDLPREQLIQYAGEDADFTRRYALEIALPVMTTQEQHLLFNIEGPLVPAILRMERRGIGLDQSWLLKRQGVLELDLSERRGEIQRVSGAPPELNLSSGPQLAKLLYNDLHLPIHERTTKKKPAVSKTALQALAHEHEVVPLIQSYRKLETELSYTKKLRAYGDRVHPSFNQTRGGEEDDAEGATATGRLSSSSPNLQQITPSLRDAFIARPGNIFVAADYSQIEPRIMAHIAKEDGLLNAFRQGISPYTYVGMLVFNMDEQEIRRGTPMYDTAKWVLLGTNYGLTAHGLSKRASMGEAEAAQIIETYLSRFPGIAEYMEDTRISWQRDGFISTLWGRRRYIPAGDGERGFRQAINHPIQGTAADFMKLAMVRCDEAKLPLILQIHDELIVEVNETHLDLTARTLTAIMVEAVELDIPAEVHVKVGKKWGSMEDYEPKSV